MKILLVEDTPYVAEFVIEFLEEKGHEVVWELTVRGGNHRLATEDELDAAIIDLQLPDGNGTTLVEVIDKEISVCMYTGLPYDAESKLKAAGITDVPCFSKSDPEKLLEWVDTIERRTT